MLKCRSASEMKPIPQSLGQESDCRLNSLCVQLQIHFCQLQDTAILRTSTEGPLLHPFVTIHRLPVCYDYQTCLPDQDPLNVQYNVYWTNGAFQHHQLLALLHPWTAVDFIHCVCKHRAHTAAWTDEGGTQLSMPNTN